MATPSTLNPNTSKQEYKDIVVQIQKLNLEIREVDAKFAQFAVEELNLVQQVLAIKDKIIDKRTKHNKFVDISDEQKQLMELDTKLRQLGGTKINAVQELNQKYGQMNELKDKLIGVLEIAPKKTSKLQEKLALVEEDKDEEEDNA